jgi:hypothetical protein
LCLTTIKISANLREISFNHSYNTTGAYLMDISAFNLHKNKVHGINKFTHNDTTLIIVEMPVYNWTVTALDYWIKEQGFFMFGWTYDNSSELPSEPIMMCNYANFTHNHTFLPDNTAFNLTSPASVPPFRVFDIPYNFTEAGIYQIKCNMSNHVSWQLLTHNVSKVTAPTMH